MIKDLIRYKQPEFELTEETRDAWVREYKEVNKHLLNKLPFPLNDFWLGVIAQHIIEQKQKETPAAV